MRAFYAESQKTHRWRSGYSQGWNGGACCVPGNSNVVRIFCTGGLCASLGHRRENKVCFVFGALISKIAFPPPSISFSHWITLTNVLNWRYPVDVSDIWTRLEALHHRWSTVLRSRHQRKVSCNHSPVHRHTRTALLCNICSQYSCAHVNAPHRLHRTSVRRQLQARMTMFIKGWIFVLILFSW